ncbi:MAG: response regulator transcription factor [Deltaproteobacteria bacterium]
MSGGRILVVDDDDALVDLVQMAFTDAGFEVEVARDGRAGLEAHARGAPDIVVLDVMMPHVDGFEVCRRLRATSRTPVVMLTSRDDEVDKIVGLEIGADDYVTKPFSVRELIARVRAVLRRVREAGPSTESVEAGVVRVDRATHLAHAGGEVLALTATEFEVLYTMVASPGRAFSRDQLIDAVYGEDIVVAHRTIDTFVKRLRKKIRDAADGADPIETVRSIGYRFRP